MKGGLKLLKKEGGSEGKKHVKGGLKCEEMHKKEKEKREDHRLQTH